MDKKKYCFAQLFEDDRDKLIELKRKMGAASIAVVVKKLIAQFGDKLKQGGINDLGTPHSGSFVFLASLICNNPRTSFFAKVAPL